MRFITFILLFISNLCLSQSIYFDYFEYSILSNGEYKKGIISLDSKISIDHLKQCIHLDISGDKKTYIIKSSNKNKNLIECHNALFLFEESEIIMRSYRESDSGLEYIQMIFYSKEYKI